MTDSQGRKIEDIPIAERMFAATMGGRVTTPLESRTLPDVPPQDIPLVPGTLMGGLMRNMQADGPNPVAPRVFAAEVSSPRPLPQAVIQQRARVVSLLASCPAEHAAFREAYRSIQETTTAWESATAVLVRLQAEPPTSLAEVPSWSAAVGVAQAEVGAYQTARDAAQQRYTATWAALLAALKAAQQQRIVQAKAFYHTMLERARLAAIQSDEAQRAWNSAGNDLTALYENGNGVYAAIEAAD